MGAKALPSEAAEQGEGGIAGGGGEGSAVDERASVAGEIEGDAGQGSDGAAGAEELHTALLDLTGDAMGSFEGGERVADFGDHGLEADCVEAGGGVALGEGDNSCGKGGVADEVRAAIGGVEADPGQLGRAAADIEEEGAARAWGEERGAARGRAGLRRGVRWS